MEPVEANLEGSDETLGEGATRLDSGGYVFTYYPRSGGLVITHGPTVIDAGRVGNPGPITRNRLAQIAQSWHIWRRDWRQESAKMRVRIHNRPVNERWRFNG